MIRPARQISVHPNGGNSEHNETNLFLSDEREQVRFDLHKETSSSSNVQRTNEEQNNEKFKSADSSSDPVEDNEPLGYQYFLCDVNIEYSPGGNRTYSAGDRHSFKLKCLPYMVRRDHHDDDEGKIRKGSLASSSSSICDRTSHQHQQAPNTTSATNTSNTTLEDESATFDLNIATKHIIDVTKATCAFLGNSDYVPNKKTRHRRVVLELISAKLSQSSHFNLPASPSCTSLVSLPEQPYSYNKTNNASSNGNGLNSSNRFGHSERTSITESTTTFNHNTSHQFSSNLTQSPSTSPLATSSKRFVNYTILIKTAPGLDNHPAVIERRFSDFLQLYQGLKSHEPFAKIVDKHVTFPKKVYMGNFSLANIAERSIEFSRLLDVCMTDVNLMSSIPFISFLLDKEIKEAHKLSLCGDPDDVQALIETAYYIEQKLYLNKTHQQLLQRELRVSNSSSPSTSFDVYNNGCYSPILLNGHQIVESSSNETISADSNYSNANRPTSTDPGSSSSPNQSVYDTNEELDSFTQTKAVPASLSQRVLVTFCMLFLTYYRGENYRELRITVQEFILLISSQDYVESMINTRHYITLRACLLFLMNMNRGNVIDESHRLWLKRRLEDIDGAYADLSESFNISIRTIASNNTTADTDSNLNSPKSIRKRNDNNNETINGKLPNVHRITKGDLTSLLRDRNFCSFQDGKSTG